VIEVYLGFAEVGRVFVEFLGYLGDYFLVFVQIYASYLGSLIGIDELFSESVIH